MLRKVTFVFKCILFLIPISFGVYGYTHAGEESLSFLNAIYSSLALYFVNPTSDIDNVYVTVAKLVGVLIAFGVVSQIVQKTIGKTQQLLLSFSDRSIAIYGDNDWSKYLSQSLPFGYLYSVLLEEKPANAKCHIFMCSDEYDSIDYYLKHEEKLKNSSVYIMLNKVDYSMLSKEFFQKVNCFNLYDTIARMFWLKYSPLEEILEKKNYKMAILNYDSIGEDILKKGIMNNLFCDDQEVEYHIWGYPKSKENFLNGLNMMNSDKIVLHTGNWYEDMKVLIEMDRIIYTKADGLEDIQYLIKEKLKGKIYCINKEIKYEDMFEHNGKIVSFNYEDYILNDKIIRKEVLLTIAKLMNYDYCVKSKPLCDKSRMLEDADTEWQKLDGFTRESNIARADYYCITEGKLEDNLYVIKKLEHIRWCRFHFWNNWEYDELKGQNTQKDKVNKKHRYLLPFDDERLPESVKEYDAIDVSVKLQIAKEFKKMEEIYS